MLKCNVIYVFLIQSVDISFKLQYYVGMSILTGTLFIFLLLNIVSQHILDIIHYLGHTGALIVPTKIS